MSQQQVTNELSPHLPSDLSSIIAQYTVDPPPKFYYLVKPTNPEKQDRAYLKGTPGYINCAPTQRVITCQFVRHVNGNIGVASYQQWPDRPTAVEYITSRKPDFRTYCFIICEQQPTRLFVDLDRKPRPADSTPEKELADVEFVITFIEDVFKQCYPSKTFNRKSICIFKSDSIDKISFHLHGAIDPNGDEVWRDQGAYFIFMTQYVQPAWNKRRPAHLDEKFFDFSVYKSEGHVQIFKLPLNSKPFAGGGFMQYLCGPLENPTESDMLQVGMMTLSTRQLHEWGFSHGLKDAKYGKYGAPYDQWFLPLLPEITDIAMTRTPSLKRPRSDHPISVAFDYINNIIREAYGLPDVNTYSVRRIDKNMITCGVTRSQTENCPIAKTKQHHSNNLYAVFVANDRRMILKCHNLICRSTKGLTRQLTTIQTEHIFGQDGSTDPDIPSSVSITGS